MEDGRFIGTINQLRLILGLKIIINSNPERGGDGEGVKSPKGGRKEGGGAKMHTVYPQGPGLEPVTYRVLGMRSLAASHRGCSDKQAFQGSDDCAFEFQRSYG